jgi:hypothetical protein
MKPWLKFYGPFILILCVLIGWTVFFTYVSPQSVVARVGIENSYLVVFILGLICGFSSITGITFYVAVAALAHGGSNPIFLGLAGGMGLCISDYAFFFVMSKGSHVIDRHWTKVSDFLNYSMKRLPNVFLFPSIFVYSAFVPFPNDIILFVLAVGRVPFKKIAPFLFAGDITFTLLLACLST